jgi:RecB family exonuclease
MQPAPAALAAEVQRVAKERHVTNSRALVTPAERGVRAEAEAKALLKASYHRFIDEKDPAVKNEAGLELIRYIFGTDSIAEDSVRSSPSCGVDPHS